MGIQRGKNTVGWSNLGRLEKRDGTSLENHSGSMGRIWLREEQELHGIEEAPRKECPGTSQARLQVKKFKAGKGAGNQINELFELVQLLELLLIS